MNRYIYEISKFQFDFALEMCQYEMIGTAAKTQEINNKVFSDEYHIYSFNI